MSLVFTPLRSNATVELWPSDIRTFSPPPSGEVVDVRSREQAPVPSPAVRTDVTRQLDPARALEMMSRASDALDHMRARCRELAESAEEASLRSSQELANLHLAAAIWKKTAETSEAHLDALKARLAEVDRETLELREKLACVGVAFTATVDTIRSANSASASLDTDILDLQLIHAAA